MPKYVEWDSLNAKIEKCLNSADYGFDNDLLNQVIDILSDPPVADVEPKQRWIPVTDNPPKVGGEYWTLRFFKRLPIVQPLKYGVPDGFDSEYFYEHDDEWEEDTAYGGITHWLPLSAIPEPPKEEDNGEIH